MEPSTNAKKLASSPLRNASTTISLPADPNLFWLSMSLAASKASLTEFAIMTPFPAANPSALTTMGATCCSIKFAAAEKVVNRPYAAVEILWRLQKSFIKALEPSNTAAFKRGPNAGIPTDSNSSTNPNTRGASGPTITKSTLLSFAKRTMRLTSVALRSIRQSIPSRAIPAFPGAHKSSRQKGDSEIDFARACSRPPEPTRRTLSLSLPRSVAISEVQTTR
mmetsp:Transcript_12580/g.20519  ORF Transcript_12580/g.20519 Transcript_12580/m.20519 type:complete len:222 (+) Transcript_12580:788-1453(+)